MPLSSVGQTAMLTWAFSTGVPTTRPTAWFASLHTSTAVLAGNEVANASGYARVTFGASGLTVAGSTASNTAAMTFGAFTGTVTGIVASGIWDSGTYGAGNLWGYGTLVQLGATYGAVAAGTVTGGATTYVVGNVLTVVGGTGTATTLTVTAVSAGAVTGVAVTTAGAYSVLPTNPVAVTGGGGTGATFDLFWSQTTSSYTVNNGDSLVFNASQLSYTLGGQLVFNPS